MPVQKELQGLVGDFSNFCKYGSDMLIWKGLKQKRVIMYYIASVLHIYILRYNQFVLRLESNLLSDPTLFGTHARYECNVRF